MKIEGVKISEQLSSKYTQDRIEMGSSCDRED